MTSTATPAPSVRIVIVRELPLTPHSPGVECDWQVCHDAAHVARPCLLPPATPVAMPLAAAGSCSTEECWAKACSSLGKLSNGVFQGCKLQNQWHPGRARETSLNQPSLTFPSTQPAPAQAGHRPPGASVRASLRAHKTPRWDATAVVTFSPCSHSAARWIPWMKAGRSLVSNIHANSI